MIEILKIVTIPLTVFLIYVFYRLLRDGGTLLPQLARTGFSWRSWITGKGMRDDADSTIRTGNGLLMAAKADASGAKRVIVEETTNLSSSRL